MQITSSNLVKDSPILGQQISTPRFNPEPQFLPPPEHKPAPPTQPVAQQNALHSWFDPIADFIKNNFRLNGAYATAAGHTISALANLFNLKSKDKIDWYSLLLSKVVLSTTCLVQAREAFRESRIWEGVSRILEPLFIIAEKRVEDLGLARSIGLGISQVAESQDGIYQELLKEQNLDPKKISMGQDHDINFTALKKILSEIGTGGLGAGRRFMTGFTWDETKKEFTKFFKDFKFSSVKELFNPEHKDVRSKIKAFFEKSGLENIKTLCKGDETRDKGHTTALSGYLMVLGGLIGYMDKASKGLLYKIGGSLRNLGGTIADVSILGHPDYKHNSAALFLIVNGALDFVQRFVPETFKRTIKFIGNLSMAFYNVGVAIYLDRSSDKTNEKKAIQRYDTDLHAKPQLTQTSMAMAA